MHKHYDEKAVESMRAEHLHDFREHRIREDEMQNHHRADMFYAEPSQHQYQYAKGK